MTHADVFKIIKDNLVKTIGAYYNRRVSSCFTYPKRSQSKSPSVARLFHSNKHQSNAQVKMSSVNYVQKYEGAEENINDIENWLIKFPGGNVSLVQDCHSGIATITLNRPDKVNAMSGQMMCELKKAVEKLETWTEGKGVLLRGSGKMFSSGGDLDFARATGNAENGFRMATFMHHVLGRLKNLPMVSAAIIHGYGALGGGAEMALSCDWRVMTKDSRGIGLVHSRMGIVPAWGATTRLTELLGANRALDLILTGKILSPAEALQIGLVDQLVDSLEEADDWFKQRTKCSAEVVRAAKVTISGNQQRLHREAESLEHERRFFAPLWGGRANRVALNSRLKHL